MRWEAPGIRQSHLSKPCLPRTHKPPSLHLLVYSQTLPKCQGRDLGDSANSSPRLEQRIRKGERARKNETVGREQALNGTVCKSHLNWRLFCNVLFFLGICEGEGTGRWGGKLFPKVLNSGINSIAAVATGNRSPGIAATQGHSETFCKAHVTNNPFLLLECFGPFRLISQAFQPTGERLLRSRR